MKTSEIVRNLSTNQVVKNVIPQWMFRSIPYPFYKNGNSYFGVYYYHLKNEGGAKKIQVPIFQVVASFPEGRIVSISASPFFLSEGMASVGSIGEYPGRHLAGVPLQESNAAYESYFQACDAFFIENDRSKWEKEYPIVCEEGMDHFFALFKSLNKSKNNENDLTLSLPKCNELGKNSSQGVVVLRSKALLKEIHAFFSQKIFSQEFAELQKILDDFSRQEYTIAMIGEFSRGKSTFMNALLGEDLLPVGNLPTTAILTKIVPSSEEGLLFIGKNGQSKKYPLTKENLESFTADADGNDPEGVLQVQLSIPWLTNKRIRFFDTPGTEDAICERANIVRDVIVRCDCTVMAISAQAPCSLTEMEFLKENVLLKSVPRCAILITKLDTLPDQERKRVVAFIKQKVSAVIPSAEFWVSQELSGDNREDVNYVGIPAIRERINHMLISDKDILREREGQMLAGVSMLLNKSKNEIDIVKQAEKMGVEQRQNTVKKLIRAKDSLETHWKILSKKCVSMQHTAEATLQKQLHKVRDSLLMDWMQSLKRTSSPKEWIKDELPYMTEKSVLSMRESLSRNVITQVMQDRTCLENEIKKQFSGEELNITLPTMEFEASFDKLDVDTEKMGKKHVVARIISSAVPSILFAVLGLPILFRIFAGGISVGTEFFMKKQIEEQKKQIEPKLKEKTLEAFSKIEEQLHEYLVKCYKELAKSVRVEAEKSLESAVVKVQEAQRVVSSSSIPQSATLFKQLANFSEQVKEFIK